MLSLLLACSIILTHCNTIPIPCDTHGNFKLVGNFCGPGWCGAKCISETECVQGVDHLWNKTQDDGTCHDKCCRAHDECCGSIYRGSQCNANLLDCLFPNCILKDSLWPPGYLTPNYALMIYGYFTTISDWCCGEPCLKGQCNKDVCKPYLQHCGEVCSNNPGSPICLSCVCPNRDNCYGLGCLNDCFSYGCNSFVGSTWTCGMGSLGAAFLSVQKGGQVIATYNGNQYSGVCQSVFPRSVSISWNPPVPAGTTFFLDVSLDQTSASGYVTIQDGKLPVTCVQPVDDV